MSDDTDPDPAAAGQRASRVGTQPVTNTSPSGPSSSPAGIVRPEIGLDDLNPRQMEAWLALVEIVFGGDEGET